MSDANTNEGGYPVSVDYNRPLEGMISEGEYITPKSDFNEGGETVLSLFSFTFVGAFTLQEVLDCMHDQGVRPLTLEEFSAVVDSPLNMSSDRLPASYQFLAVRK